MDDLCNIYLPKYMALWELFPEWESGEDNFWKEDLFTDMVDTWFDSPDRANEKLFIYANIPYEVKEYLNPHTWSLNRAYQFLDLPIPKEIYEEDFDGVFKLIYKANKKVANELMKTWDLYIDSLTTV